MDETSAGEDFVRRERQRKNGVHLHTRDMIANKNSETTGARLDVMGPPTLKQKGEDDDRIPCSMHMLYRKGGHMYDRFG